MCGYETQKMKKIAASQLIYTTGCLDKIVWWGKQNLLLVGGMTLVLLFLEVRCTPHIYFFLQKVLSTLFKCRLLVIFQFMKSGLVASCLGQAMEFLPPQYHFSMSCLLMVNVKGIKTDLNTYILYTDSWRESFKLG